jgi:hypothetical protein
MSIHINLLAEAQALEEMRRRDPVKRAIWLGAFLVAGLLAVSIWLQLQVMFRKGELNRVEGQIKARTSEFKQVLNNQQKLSEMNYKLASLQKLATNRLLYGSLLNGLQKSTIDDVQLTRFRVDQAFVLNEEIKPKTNANDRLVPGKPASVTEKVTLVLDARDSGPNPGDQVNKFKRAIAESPFVTSLAGKTNEARLTSLSPPVMNADKLSVQFTLEYRFPERTR